MKTRKFDTIMNKEFDIFKFKISVVDILFMLVIAVFGLLVRMQFMGYEGGDWKAFL